MIKHTRIYILRIKTFRNVKYFTKYNLTCKRSNYLHKLSNIMEQIILVCSLNFHSFHEILGQRFSEKINVPIHLLKEKYTISKNHENTLFILKHMCFLKSCKTFKNTYIHPKIHSFHEIFSKNH